MTNCMYVVETDCTATDGLSDGTKQSTISY